MAYRIELAPRAQRDFKKLRQSREVLQHCPPDSEHDLPGTQRDRPVSFSSPLEIPDISAQRLGYAWSVFVDVEKRLVDLAKILDPDAAAAPSDTKARWMLKRVQHDGGMK